MRQYVLTAEAEAQFEAQVDYLTSQNAQRAADALIARSTTFLERTLCRHPNIGKYLAERDLLEFWVPGTRIVLWYRFDDDTVTVISIWHTSQDRSNA